MALYEKCKDQNDYNSSCGNRECAFKQQSIQQLSRCFHKELKGQPHAYVVSHFLIMNLYLSQFCANQADVEMYITAYPVGTFFKYLF